MSEQVTLHRVRLSFPHLSKPHQANPTATPKYNANFLLNKADDAAQIDALRKACMAVVADKWPNAKTRPKSMTYCVKDGADKAYEGYGPSIIYVSASNEMPVPLVDERVIPITNPNKLYAGCYVNAVIRLWAQDNQYGKKINAQLLTVQFVADGEAFGDKPVNPADVFKPVIDTSGVADNFPEPEPEPAAMPQVQRGSVKTVNPSPNPAVPVDDDSSEVPF